MTAGDVVNSVNAVAAGADFDYVPAVGVELAITTVGAGNADQDVYLYDGVNRAMFLRWATVTANRGSIVKLFINNSIYIRFNNGSALTQVIGFSSIQIK
jgi:hypothetical protein